MRLVAPALCGLVAALALTGCQQSSTTTSSSTSSTGATSTSNSTPAAAAPSAAAPSTTTAPGMASDFSATDKQMEVGLPDGHSAVLLYKDLKVGDGSIAEAGKTADVHYTGWLMNGTKFDSSLDRGTPLPVLIGAVPPQVIEGWDKGLRGMRVGGKRRLVIPPELGYGARGAGQGVIPPNATLVFEVELVGLH